jgi:hypothetical protein
MPKYPKTDRRCFSGLELQKQWDAAQMAKFTEETLDQKFGAQTWFISNPEAAPPLGYYKPSIRDTLGRGYNFPEDVPDIAYVQLRKAPPLHTGDRPTSLPEPNEVIQLSDKRSFVVIDVDIPPGRTNTATVKFRWSPTQRVK